MRDAIDLRSSQLVHQSDDLDRLSLSQQVAIDSICDRYEHSVRIGDSPILLEYLSGEPEQIQPILFRQLFAIDLELASGQDRHLRIVDCLRRFPQYQPIIEAEAGRAGALPWTSQFNVEGELPHSTDAFSYSLSIDRITDTPVPACIGRYSIIRAIGQGGFGTVYLAFDSQLGRQVAVKVPHQELFSEPKIREMFLKEASMAARLRHRSIVTLHDIGQDGQTLFIIQEYIPGQPLSMHLRSSAWSMRQRVEVMALVAEAVAYAHQHGVVHRDLKPANILIENGLPRLVDFGLAVHPAVQNRTYGERCGTPGYMSPEQVNGESHRIDSRSDIWSLGATLYEVIAGRLPFAGKDQHELFAAILGTEPPSMCDIAPLVSQELDRICRKCLSKPKSDRYQSANDLASDLRSWLTSIENGERLGDAERSLMPRAGKRHGWYAAAIAVGLVILTTMGYEAYGRYRAREFADRLPTTNIADLPRVLSQAKFLTKWSIPLLAERLKQAEDNSREKLKIALALVDTDPKQVEYLFGQLLQAEADDFPVIRKFLKHHAAAITERLWLLTQEEVPDTELRRLRAAAALALYAREDARWQNILPSVARELVCVEPRSLKVWRDALRPISARLIGPLTAIWRDTEQTESARLLALDALTDYASQDVTTLVSLALDAEPKAFDALFPLMQQHGETALAKLQSVLEQRLEPAWDDSAIDPNWTLPEQSIESLVVAAQGRLEKESAYFQDLPWTELPKVVEGMRQAHFRLTRIRPFSKGSQLRVATVWTRDDRNWLLETNLSAADLPHNGLAAQKNGLVPFDIVTYADPASTDEKFLHAVVWSEPAPGEQRVVFVGAEGPDHARMTKTFNDQKTHWRCTIHAWLDTRGRRQLSTIWSNLTTQAMYRANQGGWERIDLPQWDVALWNVNVAAPVSNNESKSQLPVDQNQYAGVWRDDPQYESKLVLGVTPHELELRGRELAEQGFRPHAISVTSIRHNRSIENDNARPEQLRSAAVWHRPYVSNARKEQLAKQQSVAAVSLLRWRIEGLGELKPTSTNASPLFEQLLTKVWSILKFQPDPSLRSFLLNRLVAYGTDPKLITQRFRVEQDVSARRALILALGDLAWARLIIAEDEQEIRRELLLAYRDDPDPGIHGAAEWALTHLGAQEEMKSIRRELATGSQSNQRQWYVSQHNDHTMVVITPSGPFTMGAPVTESNRRNEYAHHRENLRQISIPRRFAIALHETTVVQFRNFKPTYTGHLPFKDLTDSPATNLSWYLATQYCNWLSRQEGIPESELCYSSGTSDVKNLKLKPDYLHRTGYRLLTEAEWEYACRAGTTSARYFGDSNELLKYYAAFSRTKALHRDLPLFIAWERVPRESILPGGALKPNDYGLFDMLGNASEWCYDRLLALQLDKTSDEDIEQIFKFDPSHARVIRGDSYRDGESFMRSAARKGWRPGEIQQDIGFRIGSTMPPH